MVMSTVDDPPSPFAGIPTGYSLAPPLSGASAQTRYLRRQRSHAYDICEETL